MSALIRALSKKATKEKGRSNVPMRPDGQRRAEATSGASAGSGSESEPTLVIFYLLCFLSLPVDRWLEIYGAARAQKFWQEIFVLIPGIDFLRDF